MTKNKPMKRWIAALLVVAMVLSVLPTTAVHAVGTSGSQKLGYTTSDTTPNSKLPSSIADDGAQDIDEPAYADDETVRVSIVLQGAATLDRGFSTNGIASNTAAMAYRGLLKLNQFATELKIEREALNGKDLDVVWNLTLAANIISANVKYGQIEAIKAVAGIKDVFIENQYTPDVVDKSDSTIPNMATSGAQIGSSAAWDAGYTGAGRKIAIIDTGLAYTHQSFDEGAFEYSLKGQGYDLDNLMDAGDVADVLEQLNAYVRTPSLTAEKLYVSSKIPFGYNYVDWNLKIDHAGDQVNQHGSHVAGIAAANAYVPNGEGGYDKALDTVYVQGVAPDAQIIVMKVFGANGGAYDSDYFVAVEDAIVLGCDSANLSLGGVMPGFTYYTAYQSILDDLVGSGLVMVTSAGNSYGWPELSNTSSSTGTSLVADGYLYGDDISMSTGGNPGTFSNTLSIASVDNDGLTGTSVEVNGVKYAYSETTSKNRPISTLDTEEKNTYDFVFVNGYGGTVEEFTEAGVEGKIALIWRGNVNFSLKHANAQEAGAIALIVVNNVSGTINMSLEDATIPCVSITRANGEAIWAASSEEELEIGAGGTASGQMTIHSTLSPVSYNAKYYQMSSFSSWGVPGSLILKPEITAPGGNIYSVLGRGYDSGWTGGDDQYESWSGTSMAAPQITGMTALINQFIDKYDLEAKTGLDARTLALSLLMSTSLPLIEEGSGSYYSILKQGSGLANVGAAVNAQSYILMGKDATEAYKDGKVKAELGDDPTKSGSYSYSFTINNLNNKENKYTLSTDLFTQDLFEEYGYTWLDTMTIALLANVVYTVNGETFVPRAAVEADVNKDGVTDALDAQALLDYIVGNPVTAVDGSDLDLDAGDLDGDGNYTTYDAHQILANMETEAFTVPANGKVTVEVSIGLTEAQKKYLDTYYENGAYVEGFTFVNPVADEEGTLDVTHSIPVLAFYGNWTEPSMFDHGSYVDALYGDDAPPYAATKDQWNYLTYKDSVDGNTYWQIGNPYGLEDTYPEGKAAIRSTDVLKKIGYTLIRNAAALGIAVTDADTGKVLYAGSLSDYEYSAFMYVNKGSWYNTDETVSLNIKPSALGAKEGQTINVSLVAIPEYYLTEAQRSVGLTQEEFIALIESDVLGDGAFLTTTLFVDDTAPAFDENSFAKNLSTGDLTVTVSDNGNIAYMAVYNKSGTKLYADVLAPEGNGDGTFTYTFPVGNMGIGSKCMVVACDYAGNETPVIVNYGGEDPDYTGKLISFVYSSASLDVYHNWLALDPATVDYSGKSLEAAAGIEAIAKTDATVTAAEYVNGYVFYTVGTQLYVADILELDNPTLVGTLTKGDSVTTALTSLSELAYNAKDGKLYALSTASTNPLYTIDPLTGVYEQVLTGITVDGIASATYRNLYGMAIDDDGNFYGATYGFGTNGPRIVKWTLPTDGTKTATATVLAGPLSIASYEGDLAYDHTSKILYYASSASSPNANNVLYKLDTTAEEPTLEPANENGAQLYFASHTLMWIGGNFSKAPSFAATDKVTSVTITPATASIYVGGKTTLTTSMTPWTLSDQSVTWSSSDAGVATVDENGVVTGISVGSATITATANVDGTTQATCAVTVQALPSIEMSALIYDTDSNTYWSDYNVNDTQNWEKMYPNAPSGYFLSGTLGMDNMLYVHDGNYMYAVDPDTFEYENLGSMEAMWLWSDAAPATSLMCDAFGYDFEFIGLCNGGQYLELLIPSTGQILYLDFSDLFAGDPMAAIAYNYSPSAYYDYYFVITESGALYRLTFNYRTGQIGASAWGTTGLDLSGVSDVTGGAYASMYFSYTGTRNTGVGYLVLTSYTEADEDDGTAKMNLINVGTSATATKLLSTTGFGADVWPVVSNYQFARAKGITIKTSSPENIKVYRGSDYQLDIRVILYNETGAVTYTSSDEGVAKVSENGVITGVGEGNATITVETVEAKEDGTKASVTFNVEVLPKLDLETDATVEAQITLGDGSSKWVTVRLDSMATTDKGAASETLISGTQHYDDELIYGAIVPSTGGFQFVQIDPRDRYSVKYGQSYGSDYTSAVLPYDFATMPAILDTVNGVSQPVFGEQLYVTPNYILSLDNYESTELPGWEIANLSGWSSYKGKLGAVAFDGLMPVDHDSFSLDDTYGYYAEVYYILSTDGTLLLFAPLSVYYEGEIVQTALKGSMGNIGMTFSDVSKLTMDMVDSDGDGYTDGLVIADSANGSVKLYFVGFDEDGDIDSSKTGYIGTIEGAMDIASLYSGAYSKGDDTDDSTDSTDSVVGSAAVATIKMDLANAQIIDLTVAASTPVAEAGMSFTGTASIATGLETKQTSGTLNSIVVEDVETPEIKKDGTVIDTENKTVTVMVAAEATTNGLATVTYDPALFTLKSADGKVPYISINEADGKITIAFAAKDEFSGNVAELVFTYEESHDGIDAVIAVTTSEDGMLIDGKPTTEDVPVVIDATAHVWGEPEFTWAEDGSSATATFTCELNSEHTETVEATVTSEVKTPATATENGTTTYTATVEFEGETYTDTRDIDDIPALGETEPTEPSEEPTEPSEEPTEPSEEPTEPSEEPTEPSEEPTEPSEEPTEPSEEPTEPSEEPTVTPPTGDDTLLALLVATMVLSAAALFGVAYLKRRAI